jgi:hypothetical protein
MRRGLSEGEKQGGAHYALAPPRAACAATPAPITAAGRASHACCLRAMAPFLIAFASYTTAALERRCR